jgi:hypothetical protein
VDPASGQIAHAGCPTRVTEIFIAGTEPTTVCSLHSPAPVAGKAMPAPGQVSPRDVTFPSHERPEASLP